MSTQPLGAPKVRYLDANGDPLSGGLLYSYEAGTSTPLATYTTRAGNVANANPVVLDANGEADVWMASGVDYKFELRNSSGVVQWTVDNFPSPAEASTTDDVVFDPGGRLSADIGGPLPTADVSGANAIYYWPHRHGKVPLYDGTAWSLHTLSSGLLQLASDTTKSPASAVGVTANYDMFVWNDAGVLRCTRGPAWTSDTARGSGAGTTELTQINGRYVNAVSITNGPGARRGLYVGTVRHVSGGGFYDSAARRFVWNMYHRAPRVMRVLETTDSWSYSTATWRQANASAANQLDFVIGLDEDLVEAHVHGHAAGSGTSPYLGIGLDSTTAIATGCLTAALYCAASEPVNGDAFWKGSPGIGRHYLAWLERSDGSATTFRGDSGVPANFQCGIQGEVWG